MCGGYILERFTVSLVDVGISATLSHAVHILREVHKGYCKMALVMAVVLLCIAKTICSIKLIIYWLDWVFFVYITLSKRKGHPVILSDVLQEAYSVTVNKFE